MKWVGITVILLVVLALWLAGCGQPSDPFEGWRHVFQKREAVGPLPPEQETPAVPTPHTRSVIPPPLVPPPDIMAPEPLGPMKPLVEPLVVVVPVPGPKPPAPKAKKKAKKVVKEGRLKPTAEECAQIGMGVAIVGKDRVVQEAIARGYSEKTTLEVLEACGY